jgi:hypothetical protein
MTEGGCKFRYVHNRLFMMLIDDSYHVMMVGSSLQSLSLFTLSFAKPGQFYMVSSPADLIDGLPIFVTRFLYFKVSFLGLGWA